VEVDHVQPVEPRLREPHSLIGRGVVEHRGLVHVDVEQEHALAVLQVDGRREDHGRHSRKSPRSRIPLAWLFSGWNCMPATLPRATAATNRSPCSETAITSASSLASRTKEWVKYM